MTRTPPPYAAIVVVALTATIFLYFSCSGAETKENGDTSATDSFEVFGQDLEDTAKAFDPEEASLTASLAMGYSEITAGSAVCGEHTPAEKIGTE